MKSSNLEDRPLLPWWRYTWNKDGSLASIERCESGREDSGRFVGYVQAATKELAAAAAKRELDKYARRLARALGRVKSRAEQLADSGLCIRCGKRPAPEPPHKACEACRQRVAERAKAIRHGAKPLISPKAKTTEEKLAATERTKEAARQRRVRADQVVPQETYRRACVMLNALRGALWRFDRSESPEEFRRWLLAAIDAEREIVKKRNAAERGELETSASAAE